VTPKLPISVLVVVHMPILLLAAVGAVASARAGKPTMPLLLIVAYFVVLSTVVPVTTFRYAIPIMPYVMMFSAWGLKELACRWAYPSASRSAGRFLTG